MRPFLVKPVLRLKGEITLSGDKSIAHRAVILSAISKGKTVIENFPANEDCQATVAAFKKLGIKILTQKKVGVLTVFGKGLFGLHKSKGPIFVSESGTTLRLLLGVLSGQPFSVTLVSGKSLAKRPMLRVTAPLRLMGAVIHGQTGKLANWQQEEHPPITIKGGDLHAITYKMPVVSAQVKSAILLAGLYAKGKTEVIEPIKTRDHTERMLGLFGAGIKIKQNKIIIQGKKELKSPGKIYIPGDISSASFFIVAATIVPGSELQIKNVSLNPTRAGIIRVLKRMGARILFKKSQEPRAKSRANEPRGDLIVRSSFLKSVTVKKQEIPSLIDELPILIVAACFAKGKAEFHGVEELRVKETDRIRSMCTNLKKMGANIRVIKSDASEKIVIQGIKELKGAKVSSFGDHRTAMSMVIAGLAARGFTQIDDIRCINKSFPEFTSLLNTLKE